MEILAAVRRGRRLDLALEAAAAGLDARDRRWVQEVAYGVVRFQGRLDHLLALHLRKGTASVPPPILDLLRMGAYQLLHLDGVPGYAAVSESVEGAKQVVGGRLAGVVNGVLRSLMREGGGPERFPSLGTDPLAHLRSWGSHPDWLLERWLKRWGVEGTARLVEANNRVPSLHLRPVGPTVEQALARLEEAGMTGMEVVPGSGCLRLPAGTVPAEALARVRGVIQDPAAAAVGGMVEPVPGGPVLDLCAAPGGKGFPLARPETYLVAADISPSRLRLSRENRDRLGVRAGLVVADARRPPFREAPVVIVDVPCTGTGTLARHPDARWRLSPSHLEALVGVQDEILDGAAAVVAPGGVLLYSTCSLEPEENGGRVRSFLSRRSDFRLDENGDSPPLQELFPPETGSDGGFGARMRRSQ